MHVLNPFHVLGLPRSVELDRARVQQAYLARSSALHPDLHADDPELESAAAELNKAREMLLDDEQRLTALWKLLVAESPLGPDIQRAVLEDKSLPPGFLMEMMETREEIERATATADRSALDRWEQWGAEQRAGYINTVSRLLAPLLETPRAASHRALADVKAQFNAWRYIERLLEQLAGHQPM